MLNTFNEQEVEFLAILVCSCFNNVLDDNFPPDTSVEGWVMIGSHRIESKYTVKEEVQSYLSTMKKLSSILPQGCLKKAVLEEVEECIEYYPEYQSDATHFDSKES